MDHIVRAQQHVYRAALAAGIAALVAGQGNVAGEFAEFDLHLIAGQHLAADEYALADEVGDKTVGRAVIEVVGGVPLLDPALIHQTDDIGDREGFMLVVGDQDGGGVGGLENFAQFQAQALAQFGVEVGKRLVEQHQLRSRRQRTRQGDALLLAAGKFMRKLLRTAVQAG